MAGRGEPSGSLKRMSADEFVRRLKMEVGQDDVHYAFWLGAGCSISSGIPGAGALVAERWLPKLRHVRGATDRDLDEWAAAEFEGYDAADPAAIYGPVMERLFIQEEARQREVEELCEGKNPGFGYAVLAALMARSDGLFNVALTTNFDDLIADAMYLFTKARPLVIADEALASYIRPTRMRPLVVKVHGDHRLSPRNTAAETEQLEEEISKSVGNLLHDRGVIFLGYGGNDVGIAKLFASLPEQALPLGIWWASRSEPRGVLRECLEQREAIWVQVDGFDELMLLLRNEFDLQHPTAAKFERVFSGYLAKFNELEKRSAADQQPHPGEPDASPEAEEGGAGDDWVATYVRASQLEGEDPSGAERVFLEGLERYPESIHLWLGLANLRTSLTHYKGAIEASSRALEIDPDDLNAIFGHALSLDAANQMEAARKLVERALELEPRNLIALVFLGLIQAGMGDLGAARHQLDLAIEAQPARAQDYGVLAVLADEVKEPRLAAGFHERAIGEAPDNPNWRANHARHLIEVERAHEALAETDVALERVSKAQVSTRLEVDYYRLVIGSREVADAALGSLKRAIEAGARVPSWNLETVVRFAKDHQHPDADWFGVLADVLIARAGPHELEGWSRWQQV